MKRRDAGKIGLLAGVNHFVDPSSPLLPTRNQAAIDDSTLRYNYLIALARKNKGNIDDACMMSIMDTLVEGGGLWRET